MLSAAKIKLLGSLTIPLISVSLLCFYDLSFAQDEQLRKAAELNNEAVSKMRRRNLSGAEVDLLRALVYANEHPQVRQNLGSVYYEQGVQLVNSRKEPWEAVNYLRKALEISPDNKRYQKGYAAALFSLADDRAQKGSVNEALDLYEKGVSYDQDNADAWLKAADYAWKVESQELAKYFFERAKEINPYDPDVKIVGERVGEFKGYKGPMAIESDHFILVVDAKRLQGVPPYAVLEDLERALDQVVYNLHIPFEGKITVVLYSLGEFFTRFDVPNHVIGIYDGKVRIPVPDSANALHAMFPAIRHEVAHAILHSLAPDTIPQWMEEGLAQWVEGKEIGSDKIHLIVDYEQKFKLPSVGELDQYILQKNKWAYIKAFSFTKYLISHYSIANMVQFITKVKGDRDFSEQFFEFFNIELKDAEANWLSDLSSRLMFDKG